MLLSLILAPVMRATELMLHRPTRQATFVSAAFDRPTLKARRIIVVVAVSTVCGFSASALAQSDAGGTAAVTVASTLTPQSLDVQIGEGRAVLAGTLVLPSKATRSPAVVMVSGSGPNDRYGHIRGFPAYGVIAEHLARSGTAVLLLDRRGVGGSAGNWKHERIEDRARDVLNALQWLRARPEIDAGHVGILGHSQGGWVAELAAANSPDVAFVVLMAGPGETVREQVLTDERNELLRSGHPLVEVEKRVRVVDRWLGVMDAIAPACRLTRLHPLCYTVEFDPAPALRRIHVPVLALFGELDTMVPPARNVDRIETALREGGNKQLKITVFDGANHQFWAAKSGARAEYAQLRPEYVPGFLDAISGWIATVSAPAVEGASSKLGPAHATRLVH
ncbi:alpha/beta fold hydrolase [Lysobacter sp. LF1]|uniref:Alpha/beta fold hydrolase n=1 Tax=Lysobacter stagni TaxID=3045172 RepID=A0ABT6XG31_9GAMM|nr:alpha/beta fold hydrolase [Lysobacter sp. LF1]MDI9239115.1 alpha/beta fold hydrolase [Lysobacter sp. LF1]